MVHQAEKSLVDFGDKVSPADKQGVETAVEALRQALAGEDVEAIKARTNDLMQASMKLGQAMYEAGQASNDAGGPAEGGTEGPKDDVIDADFQEIDDQDKKKRA